jgi:hypothetical protein
MELRVMMIQKPDGHWFAQGLEHDIFVQAPTLAKLRYEFAKVLAAFSMLAEDGEEDPLARLGPAPLKYWDLHERSGMEIIVERISTNVISGREPGLLSDPSAILNVSGNLAA